ncbi:hypothetical protein BH23PLA1_BH23PLA1_02790 [soil metagenome]
MAYIPSPGIPEGFPNLKRVRSKTTVKGGGGLRKRWKDEAGILYEWDSQHGRLENYNARG